jgi:uncharacterized protein (DUF111 family)
MLLDALLDVGAYLDAVKSAVAAVVPCEVLLRTSTVRRAGLRALKVDVAEHFRRSPAPLMAADPGDAGRGGASHPDPRARDRSVPPWGPRQ